MSNFTKMINDKAITDCIVQLLAKLTLDWTAYKDKDGNLGQIDIDLPKALEIAKILDIKQPSGNPFEIGNLDDTFLLEADGSPLQK